jgi:hypothetical protein
MLKLDVQFTNQVSPMLQTMQDKLDKLPAQAARVFVANTPIRSGNARRHTKLVGKTIQADYKYAQRLDEGLSNQSPAGMITPTEEFIQARFTDIMAGK